ncbi:hypothetical protein B0H14DRAFT_2605895 [Mycena olivaceomarginata]|nr:hypothetical protein B0H14DRAFT_2605895 [Mycena olivaceomarginata]
MAARASKGGWEKRRRDAGDRRTGAQRIERRAQVRAGLDKASESAKRRRLDLASRKTRRPRLILEKPLRGIQAILAGDGAVERLWHPILANLSFSFLIPSYASLLAKSINKTDLRFAPEMNQKKKETYIDVARKYTKPKQNTDHEL